MPFVRSFAGLTVPSTRRGRSLFFCAVTCSLFSLSLSLLSFFFQPESADPHPWSWFRRPIYSVSSLCCIFSVISRVSLLVYHHWKNNVLKENSLLQYNFNTNKEFLKFELCSLVYGYLSYDSYTYPYPSHTKVYERRTPTARRGAALTTEYW